MKTTRKKNRAAAEMGKRRWEGVSAEDRRQYAQRTVAAREQQRKEHKTMMRQEIMNAHLPTWLKIQLIKVSKGDRSDGQRGYLEVGWHLGYHHLDSFDVDPDNVPDCDDEAALANPTKALRQIFSNEEHPRGELTDFIPLRRRREFLRGLLYGAGQVELADMPKE